MVYQPLGSVCLRESNNNKHPVSLYASRCEYWQVYKREFMQSPPYSFLPHFFLCFVFLFFFFPFVSGLFGSDWVVGSKLFPFFPFSVLGGFVRGLVVFTWDCRFRFLLSYAWFRGWFLHRSHIWTLWWICPTFSFGVNVFYRMKMRPIYIFHEEVYFGNLIQVVFICIMLHPFRYFCSNLILQFLYGVFGFRHLQHPVNYCLTKFRSQCPSLPFSISIRFKPFPLIQWFPMMVSVIDLRIASSLLI